MTTALCLVAHPDDCIIFAYPYIHNHKQYDWTIAYLTYTEDTPRGQEIQTFWKNRNIQTKFLGYTDDWNDIKNNKISFDERQASLDIKQLIKNYDIVLTHNHDGEYGHIHHKFVHEHATDSPNLITFKSFGAGNCNLCVPKDQYSLSELPLHAEVIQSYHPTTHCSGYMR